MPKRNGCEKMTKKRKLELLIEENTKLRQRSNEEYSLRMEEYLQKFKRINNELQKEYKKLSDQQFLRLKSKLCYRFSLLKIKMKSKLNI